MRHPGEITCQDVQRALRIYLEHAYLGGSVPQRTREQVPAEDCSIEEVLSRFVDETVKNQGHVQRWILRLGNHKYPFMKFVLQEHLLEGRFFFSVDTHDQFVLQPHFPDLGGWNALKENNRKLREEIEAHWAREGLPTSSTLRELFVEKFEELVEEIPEPCGRILIADDDENLCDCVSLFLRSEGFEVIEAYDGETACMVFNEQPLDLIVLDFEMPGRNGLELSRDIRAREDERSSIPIVLTSLAELPPSRLGEVSVFLPKPFSLQQLLDLAVQLAEAQR